MVLGLSFSFQTWAEDLPSGLINGQPLTSGTAATTLPDTQTQVLSNGTSIVTTSNCSSANPLLCAHSTVITPPATAMPEAPASSAGSSAAAAAGLAGIMGMMGGGGGGKGKGGSGSGSNSGSGSSSSGDSSGTNSIGSSGGSSSGVSTEAASSGNGGPAAPRANATESTPATSSESSGPSQSSGPADAETTKDLAEAATCGAGFGVGNGMCYRGVKQIIAAGLGLDLGCTRNILSGGDAIDSMGQLPNLGFKNQGVNSPVCDQPGTVRVYRGIASKMSSSAAEKLVWSEFGRHHNQGDISGHIEVVGTDHGYYSFLRAYRPITANNNSHNGMKQRRTLAGCFVVTDSEKAHSACKSGKRCQLGGHKGNSKSSTR